MIKLIVNNNCGKKSGPRSDKIHLKTARKSAVKSVMVLIKAKFQRLRNLNLSRFKAYNQAWE